MPTLDDVDARWRQLSEEVISGMKEWRVQHPRATFQEIEAALDERLARLRARMLQDAALLSRADEGTQLTRTNSVDSPVEQVVIDRREIQSLREFTAKVAESIDTLEGERNFDKRRSIIALLDVQATLVVENGEKVVYVRCKVGEATLCINDNLIRACALSAVCRIRSG